MATPGNINLSINATSNLGNTTAALEAMRRGMAAVRTETEKYYKQVQTTGREDRLGFQKANNSVDMLRDSYKDIIQQSGLYAQSTKNITAETTRFNDQLSRQKVRLRDVVGNTRMVRDAMKEQMALNRMMVTGWRKDATGSIKADMWVPTDVSLKNMSAMRAQMGYYNQILRSVSLETVNWGKNTQWAGRQLTVGFSVPISIAAGLLGKLGASADSELVRITKVYGDTESAFQASNESLRGMAQDTARYIADQYGIAASDTRNVMAELAATGMEGAELQAMTGSVQRLSLLGEMASEDSLKLARVLKEVYGLSAQELDKQVDYFNAIENATALTMQDITEGLPRISGIMKATGTSIEEQTELLVAFKAAGIDVAEGANALKSINFKAIAGSPTAQKSFLEITGEDMDALIKKNNAEFVPMMMDISRIMKDLSQPDKMDLIARVFGIHQGSRALTLIEQLTNGSEAMARANEVGLMSAQERAALANKEIGDIQESVSTRFKRMIEGIKASLEPLGIAVLEALLPIGEMVTKLINWIGELPDGVKKVGINIALLLAAVGPLVMLAGLFGNLVGMGGRMIGWVVNLAAKFQILNADSKAATLIQKALETETDRATRALNEERIALGNLATALDGVNRSLREQLGLTDQVQGSSYMPPFIPGNTSADYRAVGGTPEQRRAAQMRAMAGAPMQETSAQRRARQMREMQGASVRSNIPTPAQTATLYKEIGKQNDAVREQARLVEEARGRWVGVAASISAASAAASGLAMLTGNQVLANVATVAMVASSVAPAIGTMSKRIGDSFLKAQEGASVLGQKIGRGLKAGAEMGKNAFASFASFALGPWGLAIGGAVLGLIYLWDRHRKQVKEMQEMYDKLADSGELLSKTYDFQPVSDLEREMAMPGNDPTTLSGQKARMKDMKESNKELYDLLQQRSKNIQENYKGEARAREAANEAMRQGAEILRQTGDAELAKQVAWDVYNTISEEWMTFDAFKIKFGADLNSLEQVADRVAQTLSGRLGQMDINIAWTGNLSKEYLEQIEADTKTAVEAINSMPNVSARHEKYMEEFAMLSTMQEMYFTAQKNGWIDADLTFTEYATNFESQVSKLNQRGINTGVTLQDAQAWESIATAINEVDPSAMSGVSAAQMDIIEGLSGVGALYRDQVDWIKIRNLEEEKSIATTEARKKEIQDEIDLLKSRAYAEAMGIDQQRVAQERLDALNMATGNVVEGLNDAGDAGGEMGEDIAEGAAEAKSALDSLSRPERNLYDAYKTSMEDLTKSTVDAARAEYDALQDAEREAFEEQAKIDMDAVESRHDALEKAAEASNKLREKSMERRHDAQKKALEADKKASMKALDARREALSEQEKREDKALAERYKGLESQLKDSQDARRKRMEESYEQQRQQIEATYDAQIEAINKQIETEERLEEHRQRMYEKERERFSRLQQMYTQNIDLNMAVNTGDLDEAARIASSMAVQQNDWATQDLSEISSDASESRRDKMQGRIDALEERKQSELDNIQEVEEAALESLKVREEAELESLKKREEAEEAALEAKYKRLEDELAAEREALDESFANRSEHLQNRQEAERENLSETLAAEREQRQTNREEDKAAQEQTTATTKAELNKRLADNKATFDGIADHWSGMTAQNFDEWVQNNGAMLDDIEKMLGVDLRGVDAAEAELLWKQRHRKQDQELSRMANDDAWKDAARIIVDGITAGILGTSFNAKEFSEFIRTGKLPKEPKRVNQGSANRFTNSVYHSGGIAGVTPGKATGPGFTGKHQEIDATLLKGEGVLNLRAMSTPGVPEMLDSLNKGYTKNSPIAANSKAKPGNRGNKWGAGGMGMLPAIAGITAGIVKQFTRLMTMAGLETGLAKAQQSVSGVDIQLGKNQTLGLNAEQLSNASAIISTGRRMGASERDILTALMTAMQESTMRNLNYGDDIHGVRNPDGSLTSSVGLFQQQNWWGSRADRLDPYKSSELFYKALFNVPNRNELPLTLAAQAVQRSAYPNAYAKWESLARVLLGGAALPEGDAVSSHLSTSDRLKALKERWEQYEESQKGYLMPTSGRVTSLFGPRVLSIGSSFHNGLDIANTPGTPIFAATSGVASNRWSPGGGRIVGVNADDGSEHLYLHLLRSLVKDGEPVRRGQRIALMGNTGSMTTGPHLHFEVRKNGRPTPAENFFTPTPRIGMMVTAGAAGMRNGGLVYGNGIGDKVHRVLEPGEFVMRKNVVDGNRALFSAINNGALNVKPGRDNIDNSRSNLYNVKVNFNGPVNKELDIQRAVESALHAVEKKKSHSRSVNNR